MEPIVIDAIRYAAVGYTNSRLCDLAGFESDGIGKAENTLEDILKTSEGVDYVRLFDLVLDTSTEYLDVGFRNGFRLGVRLMLECLLN